MSPTRRHGEKYTGSWSPLLLPPLLALVQLQELQKNQCSHSLIRLVFARKLGHVKHDFAFIVLRKIMISIVPADQS